MIADDSCLSFSHFLLSRSARKHRSERDDFLLPIGLHLSSFSSNGNSSALPSSIGRMWSEARSDEMTE